MALKRVSQRRDDALARTDWAEVERLLARHYGDAGFDVDHCGTGSGTSRYDGGIDLKLRRGEQYILVQCKHWNTVKVPHNDVHQLIGLTVNEGATGAILVTSGEFTRAAIEAATRHGHVELVDGDDLRRMLGPLPEPKTQASKEWMLSDVGEGAKEAARYAGERLLEAAEERIRAGGRRSAQTLTRLVVVKAVLGLLVPILIVLLGLSWVKDFVRPMAPAAPSANVPEPVQRNAQQPRPSRTSTIGQTDASAANVVRHEPTPEEIREQQRKAEEAIRVLEATTPELYEGRPGQVRGQ